MVPNSLFHVRFNGYKLFGKFEDKTMSISAFIALKYLKKGHFEAQKWAKTP